VKHVDPESGDSWWIPPGGGLETQDKSILDCAIREVFEETGLQVTIGKLVYLREFIEPIPRIHHIELFFLADDFCGDLTIENIKGNGPDEDWIQQLAWLGQPELQDIKVYPELLQNGFWDDLQAGFPETRYLGVHFD
jgi:ADP-ribose pyrophosphatase YjhB (NUDIX family)